MKQYRSFFSGALSVIVSLLCLMSCDPIDDNRSDGKDDSNPVPVVPDVPDTPDADPVYGGTIVINDTPHDISDVWYYYDAEANGFEFVFANTKEEVSIPLEHIPDGAVFYVDVPQVDMNTTSNLPTIIQGDDWEFYFGYGFDGKLVQVDKSFDIRSSSIKSGKMFIDLKDGVLQIKFEATVNNGDVIKCEYAGKPVKSSEYIIDWYPIVIN